MIAVVIPAYNEAKNLAKTLDSLVAQTTDRPFEVVVVDNNSTDRTAEIARSYADRLGVRVVSEKTKGRGAARRAGFAAAKGNIIFSTDADTVVPPQWIQVLSARLDAKDDPIAVTGTCRIDDCSYLTNWVFNWFQPLVMRGYRLVYGHFWLSGFSFAIKRAAYQQAGGFAVDSSLEDIDLSFRVCRIGKIGFVPNLPVTFSGRRFQNGFLRGLWPYVKIFIQSVYFKKSNSLVDVR